MQMSPNLKISALITLYLNLIMAIILKFYLYKENIDFYSRFCSINKQAKELRELREICYQNLFYILELYKRAHNKRIKSCNYTLTKKVWLNSKYIKIKKIEIKTKRHTKNS